MSRPLPLLVLAAAILAAAGLLAGSAWYGRAAAREARLETVRVRAREAVGEVSRRFTGEIDALVAREAQRPFYLYQHYFSPPDALSAQFVLQTSPLAVAAEPLVSTYFEILPDGRVSLPQEVPEGPADSAGRRLVAREVLPELVARVHRAPPRPEIPAGVLASNVLPAPDIEPLPAPAAPPQPPQPPQPHHPSHPHSQAGNAAPAEPVEQPADAVPQEPTPPAPSPPQDESQQPQVSPMPRWAVETNMRANDIARQIEVANTGDVMTQQVLQSDFNQMRGLPQAQQAPPPPPPQPAAVRPPPPLQPPNPADAGRTSPDGAASDAGATASDATGAGTSDAASSPQDSSAPHDARPDRSRTVRRRDAATAPAPPPPPPPPPTGPTATSRQPTASSPPTGGDEQVPVIYGAFERMQTSDGATYYVRTVDIERDVRVQGFRLSPGGLSATLDNVTKEVQRQHDAFRLVAGATGKSLASSPIDGVPGIAAIVAVLQPDSPTLAGEDQEDRRLVWILIGLSAVIGVAVMLAFLALRREVELARRKSDFLSAVSHELRAPVTTIRMYAEMLRDGWVDDSVRRVEYESAIVSEGERLSRLVENVLAFSRRERGKPLALRDGDLAEKVREVAGLEGPVFERAGLALDVEAPATLPWRFDGDAVTQILVNLLDNALKHSRDAAERRVTLRLAGAPDAATLAVEDHGTGIPAGEQRRIFEPFYRVGSELTRETRGAGLGLALVRRLARAHGGDVTVHSEPGKGATFTVKLGRSRTP
jgi:signal transduction histidine kinase